MAATPNYNESAFWTHRERKGFEGFDQKCFDVGHNVINVLYSAINVAKRVWGLASRKNFHNYIPYHAEECDFANIIRKLQYIISDIEKLIRRYQMINIQSHGWARSLS